MKLLKLKVTGFRSLNDAEINLSDLIVLIGENYAGKSSVLDLLNIFFNNRIPDFDDYHCDIEGNRTEKIEVLKLSMLVNEYERKQTDMYIA